MKHKTRTVSIEIYDADGDLCESVGGPMDYDDVREQMIEILRNDGIPVLRAHGKHEAGQEKPKGKQLIRAAMEANSEELKKALMDVVHSKTQDAAKPAEVPNRGRLLTLHWEMNGVKFGATGSPEDVLDAQDAFLQGIMEDD